PHGLIFERFLNPERISMPDVDIDFDERRRVEVIRYVTEKYSADKVAMIAPFRCASWPLTRRRTGAAIPRRGRAVHRRDGRPATSYASLVGGSAAGPEESVQDVLALHLGQMREALVSDLTFQSEISM
ncbi:hypothetical protein, partial [Streptomyces sp. NPDC094149]|uniref:hypothetical protein n=1 Tax=Streptomyces sp. NPDC094149 TaxID=3155079 RepID=UPI00332795F7